MKQKCYFHQNHYIQNFCVLKQCTLPLCCQCLPIHKQQHVTKGQSPQIISYQIAYDQAYSHLSDFINRNSQYKQNYLSQIHKDKQEAIRLIEKYYQSFQNTIREQSKVFDQVEEKYRKLTKGSIKTLIYYYSGDIQLKQLSCTQFNSISNDLKRFIDNLSFKKITPQSFSQNKYNNPNEYNHKNQQNIQNQYINQNKSYNQKEYNNQKEQIQTFRQNNENQFDSIKLQKLIRYQKVQQQPKQKLQKREIIASQKPLSIIQHSKTNTPYLQRMRDPSHPYGQKNFVSQLPQSNTSYQPKYQSYKRTSQNKNQYKVDRTKDWRNQVRDKGNNENQEDLDINNYKYQRRKPLRTVDLDTYNPNHQQPARIQYTNNQSPTKFQYRQRAVTHDQVLRTTLSHNNLPSTRRFQGIDQNLKKQVLSPQQIRKMLQKRIQQRNKVLTQKKQLNLKLTNDKPKYGQNLEHKQTIEPRKTYENYSLVNQYPKESFKPSYRQTRY